jgi:hypothetical protein
LSLPGIEITNQRAGVMDMSGLEKIYGRAMGGMLGFEFLSRFVVRVNYGSKTIDVLDPATFDYKGPGQAPSLHYRVGTSARAGHGHRAHRAADRGRTWSSTTAPPTR